MKNGAARFDEAVLMKSFEDRARDIAKSLRFYTSPIDPKTRKGGGQSRKSAIKMTKADTITSPKLFNRAFELLGWKRRY